MDTTTTTETASVGASLAVPTGPDRRAAAWLDTRIVRGKKERFCEVVKITPALASQMLERNTSNRNLSESTAQKYANIMMEGRWRLTSESISFDRGGNLINGQHRLSAVVYAGVTVDFTVWFGCATEEFAFVDQGRSRTASDLLSIDGMNNFINRAAAAQLQLRIDHVANLTFDVGYVRSRAHKMAGRNMDVALCVGDRARHIVSKTVATWTYWTIAESTSAPEKMDAFWEGLITGAELSPKSPILRVREFLRSYKVNARNSRDRAIKEAAVLILAWNAYTKGNTPRSFDWPHAVKLPEVA